MPDDNEVIRRKASKLMVRKLQAQDHDRRTMELLQRAKFRADQIARSIPETKWHYRSRIDRKTMMVHLKLEHKDPKTGKRHWKETVIYIPWCVLVLTLLGWTEEREEYIYEGWQNALARWLVHGGFV